MMEYCFDDPINVIRIGTAAVYFRAHIFLVLRKSKNTQRSPNNTHFTTTSIRSETTAREVLFPHTQNSLMSSSFRLILPPMAMGVRCNCVALRYETNCSTFEVNKRTFTRPIFGQNHLIMLFKFPNIITKLPELILTIFTAAVKNFFNFKHNNFTLAQLITFHPTSCAAVAAAFC